MQVRIRTSMFALVTLALVTSMLLPGDSHPLEPRQADAQELPAPDSADSASNNNYVGMTKCAACHYSQYKDWKETPHGNAFKILPAKYRQDASCLQCHATGHGQKSTSDQPMATAGVACEACHGPGGDHTSYGLTFVGQGRELTDESLEVLRSKIERHAMGRCIKCHTAAAHKPHPEFDQSDTADNRGPSNRGNASAGGLFQQVHRN